MDRGTWFNIGLVLVFILVGGMFAGTEIALVSLRKSQLTQIGRQSHRGARVAAVARDPNRFLAAVQIGVTVAGFFSAAYGAATLAPDFVPWLEAVGLPDGVAAAVSVVVLTLVIAYLSLVLGELVPKRLALQRSAVVALAVAPLLDRFATAMRPVIWLLSVSTNAIMRILGGDPRTTTEEISEEELREIVIAHEGLAEDERRIVNDVFDAADRSIGEVMRPRGEVVFVQAELTLADAIGIVRRQPFSRYPVIGVDFDDVLGFLHVRDLLDAPPRATVRDLMRGILPLPATNRLLPSLSVMRRERAHIAVVVDEYGGTDGIVTLEDLVEELVGDIRDEYDREDPVREHRSGGVVRVYGGLTIEDFAEQTGIELEDGPYETVAGYVIDRLGRLGRVGDTVVVDGSRLLVAEVRDRRIVRIDVTGPTDAAADDRSARPVQGP